jgi:hypothetical protein
VYVRSRVFVKGSGDGPGCRARACAVASSATATAATLGSSTPACSSLRLYASPPYILPAVLGMDIPSMSDSRDGERCKEDAGPGAQSEQALYRMHTVYRTAVCRLAQDV